VIVAVVVWDCLVLTIVVGGWFLGDIRSLKLGGVEVLTFVFEVFDALWNTSLVTEAAFGFFTSQARAFIVLVIVSVPGVTVFDGELTMPLSIGWFVDFVDVDVTALTQRNQIVNAVISIVAIDMVQRQFVLDSVPRVGLKPFVWGSTADHALAAPTVKHSFFDMCWSHIR